MSQLNLIPKELEAVLVSDPETLSGAIKFKGTRVPVQILFDTIYSGKPISDFLEGFPNVSLEQASAVAKWETNQARKALGLELVAE